MSLHAAILLLAAPAPVLAMNGARVAPPAEAVAIARHCGLRLEQFVADRQGRISFLTSPSDRFWQVTCAYTMLRHLPRPKAVDDVTNRHLPRHIPVLPNGR
jgi:hypothetical protein